LENELTAELKTTALNDVHRQMGARMVDFGGYDMPVNYGSQIEEHHAVRNSCGIFDVSHMGVVDVTGVDTEVYLRYLLANDVARLNRVGAGQYSLLLNEAGGVIDDLILYKQRTDRYRLVVNCGNKDSDLAWMQQQAKKFDVRIAARPDKGILALQGPQAAEILAEMEPSGWAEASKLKRFQMTSLEQCNIARTGYTGEDGFEIICPNEKIERLWCELIEHGATAAGLGARDTLRLEAGYCLWGHEMDQDTSPLEANLSWTIQMNEGRDFIGRSALESQRQLGIRQHLVGLVLEGKGVIRDGCAVETESGAGLVTSGSYSPTLEASIALARIPINVQPGTMVRVLIRGRRLDARVVKPAFVSQGKKLFE
jgi:aminomethyltransferase